MVPTVHFLLRAFRRPRSIDSVTTFLHSRERAIGTQQLWLTEFANPARTRRERGITTTKGRADAVWHPPWGTGAMRRPRAREIGRPSSSCGSCGSACAAKYRSVAGVCQLIHFSPTRCKEWHAAAIQPPGLGPGVAAGRAVAPAISRSARSVGAEFARWRFPPVRAPSQHGV